MPANETFKKELDFVKSITVNSDWNDFLNIKLEMIQDKFKLTFNCKENICAYINCLFIFSSLKNNLSMSAVCSHIFYCWRVTACYADCKYCICSNFFIVLILKRVLKN